MNGTMFWFRRSLACHTHVAWLMALAVGLALTQAPSPTHATSCMPAKITVMMLCGNFACTDGFKVTDEPIVPMVCGGLPKVHDLDKSELTTVTRLLRRQFRSAPNTIYQVELYPVCLGSSSRDARCESDDISITTLDAGDGAETLAHYKAEWLEKERKVIEEHAASSATTMMRIGQLTLLSIVWPWIAVVFVPFLRKYLVFLLIVAVLGQAFVIFAIIFISSMLSSAGGNLATAGLCLWLIKLAIPLQFTYPLLRTIRRKFLTA